MNAPRKYVVSKTLQQPTWRNTTIIRDSVIESVRELKAQPGKNILTDGSSQLVHALLAHDLVDELGSRNENDSLNHLRQLPSPRFR